MLNSCERKVLKYLQRKNDENRDKVFGFRFVDHMFEELGDGTRLIKTLLSLELSGYITLHKTPAKFEYATSYKSGDKILAIRSVELNEEGLIYDVKYKKNIMSHFFFSFFVPVFVSVTASVITWVLLR